MKENLMHGILINRCDATSNKLTSDQITEIINYLIPKAAELYKLDSSCFYSKTRKKEPVAMRKIIFFILRYNFEIGPLVLKKVLVKNFNIQMDHSSIIHYNSSFFDAIETYRVHNQNYRTLSADVAKFLPSLESNASLYMPCNSSKPLKYMRA